MVFGSWQNHWVLHGDLGFLEQLLYYLEKPLQLGGIEMETFLRNRIIELQKEIIRLQERNARFNKLLDLSCLIVGGYDPDSGYVGPHRYFIQFVDEVERLCPELRDEDDDQ